MRMVYPKYGITVDSLENMITVFSVENPIAFREMAGDFWRQLQGQEGGWILSEGGEQVSIAKKVMGVINPFLLECNDKKVLNKLYADLSETARESFFEETAQLNGNIVSYIENLTQNVQYQLDMGLELDVTALLKAYNVRIQTEHETLTESIIEYLRVLQQICNIHFFLFVNLKQYVTEQEIQEIYEYSFYNKIELFLLEGNYKTPLPNEKNWIFDRDLCMIEV